MKQTLKIGQIIEIREIDGPMATKHRVRVVDIRLEGKSREVIIEVPIVGGSALSMQSGSCYEMTYYKNASIFIQKGRVSGRLKAGSIICARLVLEGDAKRINRRQYFRLSVLIDGHTKRGDAPMSPMTTTNLSAGGLRFVSLDSFKSGENIMVRLDLDGDILDLHGEVISCDLVPDSIRRHDVRMKFENITSAEEQKIMAYLFEQQRLIKRKGLA